MKKYITLILGIIGLAVPAAYGQTLINSWENSLEGWTVLQPSIWTSPGFSTNGVSDGTNSLIMVASGGPNYGGALQGPSSTALTSLLANAYSVSVDVYRATNGNTFGYGLQIDLDINQPGGLNSQSINGYNYLNTTTGQKTTLTYVLSAGMRATLAANPTLAANFVFQIGGGDSGTAYFDNLRINELPSYVESWEGTLDGWSLLQPAIWSTPGFSTNGVTDGTNSLIMVAASGPNYGPALQSASSTTLAGLLANAASLTVDVYRSTNGGTFGYGLQIDLDINQPGGLGYQSINGYNYLNTTTGQETTLTYAVSPAMRATLAANPTLAAGLTFQIGGGADGTAYFDNLRIIPLGPPQATAAKLFVREMWDDILAETFPATQTLLDDVSSLGFASGSPWTTNPRESGIGGTPTNTTAMAVRANFIEPNPVGIPTTLDGSIVALVQENSRGTTLYSSGDWMTRQLASQNFINFSADGEYWFSMTIGEVFDAQYSGGVDASGGGGIGFANGSDTNADYVAVGVTGTNVFLGNLSGGTTYQFQSDYAAGGASKTVYISQGTLGQAGNTNSLIYNIKDDPFFQPGGGWPYRDANGNAQGAFGASLTNGQRALTNYTGGPYHVNAYATNRVNQAQGDGIVILAHLTTHTSGNATLDAKFYNSALGDQMDITNTPITWDCSYAFNFTGTMTRMLVFENGEFPFYIYGFRASTNLAGVLGIDPGYIKVAPLANTFVGFPINMTNTAADANPGSSTSLPSGYDGTLTYQWFKNGTNIAGVTDKFLNFDTADLTNSGTYTSVGTDPSGYWGSVTTAPVVINVVDEPAPVVAGLRVFEDGQTFQVTLNEPNLTGADQLANFVLSGGATVTNLTAVSAGQTTLIQLQSTLQAPGTRLTLTLNNITNQAGHGIAANTTISFWTDVLRTNFVSDDEWATTGNLGAFGYFNNYLPSTPHPTIGTNFTLTSWEQSPNTRVNGTADQVAGRMYGWFIAPATTNYVFFLACDDAAKLSLSTNSDPSNLCVIAAESLWSNGDSWTNFSGVFPTGPHRGDGTATGVVTGNASALWDNSVAAQAPGSACDQNRSDQFIVAYYDSSGLPGGPAGATNSWGAALSQVTDVVPSGTTNFWPKVDANGQALISLTAGQKYYIQAEHYNNTGGFDCSVTYKYAGAADPTNSPSILTGNVIAAMVGYTSIAIGGTHAAPVITYVGQLQSSATVNGTYTDVNGASSADTALYNVTPTGTALFYRVRAIN